MTNKGIARAAKEKRHEKALAAQADYDTLTPEQKLAKLDNGNFRAVKQRAKLQKLIDANQGKNDNA